MKITLAQLNPIVGDIKGNLAKAKKAVQTALREQSDLIVFSELFLSGYPPRDFLSRQDFLESLELAIGELVSFSKSTSGIGILMGAPERVSRGSEDVLYNAAFLIENGRVLMTQRKTLLPFYDVFDEPRYFRSAENSHVFVYKGESLGISICEDAWFNAYEELYHTNPIAELKEKGATLFINMMASPFEVGKSQRRFDLFQHLVYQTRGRHVFVNQVGGNDELVFDGGSLVLNEAGNPVAQCVAFGEQLLSVDLSVSEERELRFSSPVEDMRAALVLGIRDYVCKTGFKKVLIGLSGGIDSALTAALAVEALGSENVLGIGLPSQYSSDHSKEDAIELAERLRISFEMVPIKSIYEAFEISLSHVFKETLPDVTEENLQARIRGTVLMAISNKFGALLLSTGNKSEMAVGYSTLYGDMNGALSVLSDVYKTDVYRLALLINQYQEIIPRNTLEKAPSAELRPGQKDSDSLPDYDVLDEILRFYIEKGVSKDLIVMKGFDAGVVDWVVRAIHRNEYKRRQAALGIKVSSKAFGSGRRFPIASKLMS